MKPILTMMITVGLMAGAKSGTNEAVKRLGAAQDVLTAAMQADDHSIPKDLIEKAHCVAIIPGLKKAGFIVGAKYGKGVMFCRKEGGGWRGPATVRVEGGSFGLQIGAGETDVILLVMNKSGSDSIIKDSFKMGGEAGVMAGPVGRAATAETDAVMKAKILAYSRARGVFAGVALEGSTLRQDLDDNKTLYGKAFTNEQILTEAHATPKVAIALRNKLTSISKWEK